MSAGPINQHRKTWLPPQPSLVRAGKLVRIVDGNHPEGYALWRVVSVDGGVATLGALTAECPFRSIKRFVRTLHIERES
jgi:hypothetical protein